MAARLLARGAKPDLVDEGGATAPHLATLSGDPDTVGGGTWGPHVWPGAAVRVWRPRGHAGSGGPDSPHVGRWNLSPRLSPPPSAGGESGSEVLECLQGVHLDLVDPRGFTALAVAVSAALAHRSMLISGSHGRNTVGSLSPILPAI